MATPVVYQDGWFGAYTMLFGAAGLVCGSQSVVFAFTARLFTDSIGLTDGRWGTCMSSRGWKSFLWLGRRCSSRE